MHNRKQPSQCHCRCINTDTNRFLLQLVLLAFVLLLSSCRVTTFNQNLRELSNTYTGYAITPEHSHVYKKGDSWYVSGYRATFSKKHDLVKETGFSSCRYHLLHLDTKQPCYHPISSELADIFIRKPRYYESVKDDFKADLWRENLDYDKRFKIIYPHLNYEFDFPINLVTNKEADATAVLTYPLSVPVFVLADVPTTVVLHIGYLVGGILFLIDPGAYI